MSEQQREIKLPLDIGTIQECIPHRYPFLLLDRVLEFTPNECIVGVKNISVSEPSLQGHFPGNPVMPGVLVVEGLAQASAVLGKLSSGRCEECLLLEVNDTRFRRKVVPGDVLTYRVSVERRRSKFYWFYGEATVDGEVAATSRFSAKLS